MAAADDVRRRPTTASCQGEPTYPAPTIGVNRLVPNTAAHTSAALLT
jgi:hypothetical protein